LAGASGAGEDRSFRRQADPTGENPSAHTAGQEIGRRRSRQARQGTEANGLKDAASETHAQENRRVAGLLEKNSQAPLDPSPEGSAASENLEALGRPARHVGR
jgi:hypothetical protein